MSSETKRCATPGCEATFFIGDSHLDCCDHCICEKTELQTNPDGVPCMYCHNWSLLQFQAVWKRCLAQDQQLKSCQFWNSLFLPPPSQPLPSPMKAPISPLQLSLPPPLAAELFRDLLPTAFALNIAVPHSTAPATTSTLSEHTPWPEAPVATVTCQDLALRPSHHYRKRQVCKRTSCGLQG